MDKVEKEGIHLFLLGTRNELDKIEAVFQWLKINLNIKKTRIYTKALLWIASDEKARKKFIEFLLAEKAKDQIVEIKK